MPSSVVKCWDIRGVDHKCRPAALVDRNDFVLNLPALGGFGLFWESTAKRPAAARVWYCLRSFGGRALW